MEDILKFATCSEFEPALRFAIHTLLEFTDNMYSWIPNANTCINRLTLPIGQEAPNIDVFEKYDLAFKNDYFGIV